MTAIATTRPDQAGDEVEMRCLCAVPYRLNLQRASLWVAADASDADVLAAARQWIPAGWTVRFVSTPTGRPDIDLDTRTPTPEVSTG